MARFSDLPNELIDSVWRHILDPETVEAFACISPTIHALGSAAIAEHNELKWKFRFMCQPLFSNTTPVDTLRFLLQNPRACSYIRETFCGDGPGLFYHGHVDHIAYPNPDEDMELFREAVIQCPFISEDEVADWLEGVEGGNEVHALSLVLSLLPKIHSLNLAHVPSSQSFLFEMIKRIAASQETEALSGLTEVKIVPRESLVPEEFEWVQVFATLPSVKSIEAWGIGCPCECVCHDGYNGYRTIVHRALTEHPDHYRDRPPLLQPKTSAVTHVAIEACNLNKQRFFGFCEGLRALESFHYRSGSDTIETSQLQYVIDALLAHTQHSLRKINIKSERDTWSRSITLAGFKVLKNIKIDYDLLQACNEGGSDIIRFANVLPPSIEKIHLNRRYTEYHHDVEDEVLAMILEKPRRLPNLKKVKIKLDRREAGLHPDIILDLKQKFQDVGVLFTVHIKSPFSRGWSPQISETW